jgi:hypothetical protein
MIMKDDHTAPDAASARGPNKPAYDNPVGNKGDLAVGPDSAKQPRPKPDATAPEGHDSDKVLGRKPPR